ncbi:MAG: ribonuclease R [Thermodesulfovibrionales bacterium]
MVNKEKVLEFLSKKSSRPLSFKEIAFGMGLSRPEGRALKRVLRQMTAEGAVVRTRKGLYGAAEEMSLVTGYFEAHRDGFGFVIPEKPGERDIFIPPRATRAAMEGDRVVARVEDPVRRQGSVVRILERAQARIAGRMDVSREGIFVKPKARSVPFDVVVAPRDRGGARDGDSVIVEITGYPDGKRPFTGRVVKVVAEPEDPKADVEAIIEEFGLPRRFPRDAREEAQAARARKPGRRKDLTRLKTVTIDGERAKDFDDAVSVELAPHGYRLWVHIADVGHYVGWDSALDLEARRRGTSVYFPDRVIPMLPKELSEDLCSLKPGVNRPAFTAEMVFDRQGRRESASFYPSMIKSDERMTYTSVRKVLVDADDAERRRYDGLLQELELMGELCGVLRRRRLERGSLDFDLPEPEVLLDLQGRPEAIIKAERNFAHMIIEEFMIAANEAVAEHLEGLGVPCLYRIHEEPDPMKVEELMKIVRATLGPEARSAVRPPARGARKRPGQSPRLHKVLEAARGRPEEEVITYLILRSLKQARYSPENVGHFGLASECYAHFTSPIRRYPDLVVHRVLREVVSKKAISEKRMKWLAEVLPDIAFSSSQRERLADDAERAVTDSMRMWFMRDKVGEEFDGKVTGVTPYGVRVRLDDFYVEGFIHISLLADDFYFYDDRSLTLRGRHSGRAFRIGQPIRVRVDRVDMEEREISFGTA